MIVNKEQAVSREVVPGIFQIHYIDKCTGSGGVSMGSVTLKPGTMLNIHTHKVEDAMVIIEGKGLFFLDGEEHSIEKGMAVVAPAGVPHGLKNDGTTDLKLVYTWPAVEVDRYFIK